MALSPLRLCAAALALSSSSARIGDTFGTNIHFTTESVPGEIALLSTAFRVARMDFSWAYIESTCGKYNFTAYDALLESLEAHGVRSYWIIDYTNSCYPSPGAPASSCSSPACVGGYGRLAAAAASHYKGHSIIWETVNEPNGMGGDNASDISALAAAAGAAMRAEGEFLVGPATAGIDFAYLNASFAAGLLSSVAGVSVHPYRANAPESAAADLASLRALMTSRGAHPDMAMIAGEWGYTTAPAPCKYGNKRDRVVAGKYVPRMWLTDLLGGASVAMIQYDWRDDGTNATDCESNFGSVENAPTGNPALPFTPKPAFLAARAAQTTIGNSTAFAGRVAASVDAAGAAAGVAPTDAFVLAFSDPASFAVYTNVTTCAAPDAPGGRAACAGVPPDAPESACLAAGCCYDGSGPTASAACYAEPGAAETCPGDGDRTDCGFDGISEEECVDTRGCCWAAAPGSGPQCFLHAVTGTFNVSFSVAPAADDACFSVVDVFGFARESVCAVGGRVNVKVNDGPRYLV